MKVRLVGEEVLEEGFRASTGSVGGASAKNVVMRSAGHAAKEPGRKSTLIMGKGIDRKGRSGVGRSISIHGIFGG